MACVVALGWVIQRRGLLSGHRLSRGTADGAEGGAGARAILATLSFTICAPALMFSTLAGTDLAHVVSRGAAVTWATTAALALVTAAVARWVLRLPAGPAAVTTLAAVYVNGGNIGIPLAVYLFDDALAVVPTLLFQLLVLAPLTLAVLDRADASASSGDGVPRARARSGWTSVVHVLLAAIRNPITLGTLAGLLVAVVSELTGARLPDVVLIPFDLIGAAAPPLGLLTFGMTLAVPMPAPVPPAPTPPAPDAARDSGRRPAPAPWWVGRDRLLVRAVVALAVLVRNVLHPLAAWALGTAVGLDAPALALVVTMAALPTAVNVTTYATRYGVFDGVAARATVWTTALCVPVLVAVGALLG
ncbi:AEC family transporter [Promicromonospora sp. AC04]|uniref:AEC family transporter n=1 Tax=Promicromonospora sp. AC04 TaxID=2135723 RepID=UPI000D3D1BFE|nr:AEC family transporter [Promicromonospora sp. AC04]